LTYRRADAVKYVSHLDIMRYWERAFRRAHLPLALSQGFHPHPRISLAAPLPVGVTSDAELMDVYLDEPVRPDELRARLTAQMAPGFEVLTAEPVAEELPSLQSLVRYAEYLVTVETSLPQEAIERATRVLLAKAELPWKHLRDGEERTYDLRPLIDSLWVAEAADDSAVLGMRLQNDGNAAGRPEQVALALGFTEPPLRIHRTRLVLGRAPLLRTRQATGKNRSAPSATHSG
jgi:radical SAM-linked protein